MSIFSFLENIISPVTDLIDNLTTSDEEKMALKNELTKLDNAYKTKVLELEKQYLSSQSQIIQSETKGESFLQRNWRPMLMLWFSVLLGLYWFGAAPEYLTKSPELVDSLFSLLKIGIGGYIVSRGGEKIVKEMRK